MTPHAIAGFVIGWRGAFRTPLPDAGNFDGAAIDAAVGQLLVATVTPLAIEVALAVQQEIQARLDDADRLRRLQVERAQYAAELARQRYLHVDPANRLVADALEADWNQANGVRGVLTRPFPHDPGVLRRCGEADRGFREPPGSRRARREGF